MWERFITALSLKMTLSLANLLNIMGSVKVPKGLNNKGGDSGWMGQEGIRTQTQWPEPSATHPVLSRAWGWTWPACCGVPALACTSSTWPRVFLAGYHHHTHVAAVPPAPQSLASQVGE